MDTSCQSRHRTPFGDAGPASIRGFGDARECLNDLLSSRAQTRARVEPKAFLLTQIVEEDYFAG